MSEKGKILLADDDFLTREVITDILKSGLYDVVTAENGRDAMDKYLNKDEYLLVITDLNMPEMDGMELLQRIREINPDQPVIILTGNSEVQVAMETINKGANDYLLKDENISNTVLYSINRVMEKQQLIFENRKLMDDILLKNRDLEEAKKVAEEERKKADKLLLNILPAKVAEELKEFGKVKPLNYPSVTVMFADLTGFTKYAWNMKPCDIVEELDVIFETFDRITVSSQSRIEKLKTIGDAYMCAGGLPETNNTHPVDICLAALQFQQGIEQLKSRKKDNSSVEEWKLRIGIHTGPVTAGVIGKTKSTYDMWGDSVNVASRMESTCVGGRINISEATYELVKDYFVCEPRGEVEIKNRGKINMYFLNSIQPELSLNGSGMEPSESFFGKYKILSGD